MFSISLPDTSGAEHIIAAVTSLLVAAGAFIRWYLPYWDNRKHRAGAVEGFQALRVICQTLDRSSTLGSERTILFGAHDSGGFPKPGAPFYTTPLQWKVREDKTVNIQDFHALSVDSAYIDMLLELERHGTYRYNFDETHCMLGRIYAAEGIKDAFLVFLGIHEYTFFYVSFASFDRKFTKHELTNFELLAGSLAHEIKKA